MPEFVTKSKLGGFVQQDFGRKVSFCEGLGAEILCMPFWEFWFMQIIYTSCCLLQTSSYMPILQAMFSRGFQYVQNIQKKLCVCMYIIVFVVKKLAYFGIQDTIKMFLQRKWCVLKQLKNWGEDGSFLRVQAFIHLIIYPYFCCIRVG